MDLAKKLSNPVADLIRVPIQMNVNFGGGFDLPERHSLLRVLPRRAARVANRPLGEERDQSFRFLMNVQPVIPISVSEDWNIISRTIVPVAYQDDFLGTTSQGGPGDTTQSPVMVSSDPPTVTSLLSQCRMAVRRCVFDPVTAVTGAAATLFNGLLRVYPKDVPEPQASACATPRIPVFGIASEFLGHAHPPSA